MSEQRSWRPPSDEDDEEEIEDFQYQAQKDAVIFAIEISKSMLTKPPKDPDASASKRKRSTDSPASAALQCAYELMQQRIISNPKDLIGVLLYGTAETEFPTDLVAAGLTSTHSRLVIDLGVPTADDVRNIRGLVEDEAAFIEAATPSDEPVAVTNILFAANQIFTKRAPTFASRRLFLVTDQDDPHPGDKPLRESAVTRARDLYDLGVSIELFPISKAGHRFNRKKFYTDIIYSNSPSDPDAPLPLEKDAPIISTEEGISVLQSLLSSVRSRSVPKRALFLSVPLEIGPNFKISVKGYIIFKRQEPARKSYVWLKGEKAEVVTSHSSKSEGDSGVPVEKDRLRKAYKFGGAQVIFTPEEIAELRNFGEPVIRIIGFKSQGTLPIWANLRPSTFIYPSEEGYVGSTRVFSALQQKLLRDKKLALVWFIARRNAAPVMAALLPGEEQLNEDNDQVIPPGMWIVPLPFADDIRKDPATVNIVSPDSVTNAMHRIIEQLQLPKARYAPERYPNPSLQWHYRILQALALDEDIPAQPEDRTTPKYRQMQKRAGSYVQEWGQELEKQHRKWREENPSNAADMASAGDKRPATKNVRASNVSGKKIMTEGPKGVSDQELRAAVNKQAVEKFKVTDLKDWLDGKNLKTTGKKADLVARVEGYFDK